MRRPATMESSAQICCSSDGREPSTLPPGDQTSSRASSSTVTRRRAAIALAAYKLAAVAAAAASTAASDAWRRRSIGRRDKRNIVPACPYRPDRQTGQDGQWDSGRWRMSPDRPTDRVRRPLRASSVRACIRRAPPGPARRPSDKTCRW